MVKKLGSVGDSNSKVLPKKAYSYRLDETKMDKLRAYSKATGVPVGRLIEQALDQFIETTMEARLDALTRFCKGDRKPVGDSLTSPAYTIEDAMAEGVVIEANAKGSA